MLTYFCTLKAVSLFDVRHPYIIRNPQPQLLIKLKSHLKNVITKFVEYEIKIQIDDQELEAGKRYRYPLALSSQREQKGT